MGAIAQVGQKWTVASWLRHWLDVIAAPNLRPSSAAAYRTALTWCGVFLGTDQEPEFDLNTDFEIGRMSAQDRAQLITEWQAGAIAFEEMRFNLRRANVAYLDDEEAKDAIEEEMASGMGAGAALVYAQQMQQEQDPDADPNKDPQGNGGNNQPQ